MTTNGYGTVDQLFAPAPVRYRDVDAGQFGKWCCQSLTEDQLSDYELELLAKKGGMNRTRLQASRRRLIALCYVDRPGGQRLVKDGEEHRLAGMDAALAKILYDAAREHCGLDEGDVEELIKNSERITVVDSPTD